VQGTLPAGPLLEPFSSVIFLQSTLYAAGYPIPEEAVRMRNVA
jgi:hypothetical protein